MWTLTHTHTHAHAHPCTLSAQPKAFCRHLPALGMMSFSRSTRPTEEKWIDVFGEPRAWLGTAPKAALPGGTPGVHQNWASSSS